MLFWVSSGLLPTIHSFKDAWVLHLEATFLVLVCNDRGESQERGDLQMHIKRIGSNKFKKLRTKFFGLPSTL